MNTELTAENLESHITPEGVLIDTTVMGYLRSNGYNIEDIHSLHVVERKESDTGHLVVESTVATKQRDDPEYDAVADKTEVHLCDCWAFRSDFPDLRESVNDPTDIEPCPHISEVVE